MEVFELFSKNYNREKQDRISLQDYLLACRDDPTMYAIASERMIAAIGKPEIFDTSIDPRFGRIFFNRTIKRYPAFSDFYGMEETIERIVGYFKYAAQGLEEARQILYLLGPVGGGKSSLAERLKTLMEVNPIYVLAAGDQVSPVFESPLALFHPDRMGDVLQDKYGVERRRLKGLMSPCGKAARRVQRRHLQFRRGASVAVKDPPDRHHQDRAGRREQPGHRLAGRQGRYSQTRALQPERPRRL